MNMFKRKAQRNEFIKEPCNVYATIVLRYHHLVFIFRISIAESHAKHIRRSDRHLHVIQTAVARHINNTPRMEVHLKTFRRGFSDAYSGMDISLPDARSFHAAKERIVHLVFQSNGI